MLPTLNIRPLLNKNLEKVTAEIQQACRQANRDPAEIKIIWVSKTRPRQNLLDAYAEGARMFGENKVQEALDKFPLPGISGAQLHFIGRLQSNKVRKIVPLCHSIHSVDSEKLLRRLESSTPGSMRKLTGHPRW